MLTHVIEEFPYEDRLIELLITYEPIGDHEIDATWNTATFFTEAGEVLRRSTNCRQKGYKGDNHRRNRCQACLNLQFALERYLDKHPLGRILAQREALKGAGG